MGEERQNFKLLDSDIVWNEDLERNMILTAKILDSRLL